MLASKLSTDALTDPWGDYCGHDDVTFSLRWCIVRSGYHATENPEIHRLSRTVLRLATIGYGIQALVAVGIFVLMMSYSRYDKLVDELIDVVLTLVIGAVFLKAGVHAVESRNATCACGWRYMQLFRAWYILSSVVRGTYLAVYVAAQATRPPQDDPEFIEMVIEGIAAALLTIILNIFIAEYARRLLNVLPDDDNGGAASRQPSFLNATVVMENL